MSTDHLNKKKKRGTKSGRTTYSRAGAFNIKAGEAEVSADLIPLVSGPVVTAKNHDLKATPVIGLGVIPQ